MHLSSHNRYCGVFTGIRQLRMGELKTFLFHSNGGNTDVGFSIYVKQVECEATTPVPPLPIPTVPGRSPRPTFSPTLRPTITPPGSTFR